MSTEVAQENKVIGVVQVKALLEDGKTRDDIAEYYGITKGECKILFQDERLKGLKTKKKPSFTLVDDAAPKEEVAEKVAPKLVDDADASDENGVDDPEPAANTTDPEEKEEEKEEAEAPQAEWGD